MRRAWFLMGPLYNVQTINGGCLSVCCLLTVPSNRIFERAVTIQYHFLLVVVGEVGSKFYSSFFEKGEILNFCYRGINNKMLNRNAAPMTAAASNAIKHCCRRRTDMNMIQRRRPMPRRWMHAIINHLAV